MKSLGSVYVFFLATVCIDYCASLVAPDPITHEYSDRSGGYRVITTPNYQHFSALYEQVMKHGSNLSDGSLGSMGYNMSERLVHTYSFTNNDTSGVIRIMFTEYDLNPNSLIYIYDGSNVTAPGSLWTSNSPAPVFSSTGPHLFMVFKTGQVDANNTHLGFMAQVSFASEHTWTDKPSHGLCGSLQMFKWDGHSSVFGEIKYNRSIPGLPVACSYTVEVLEQAMLTVEMHTDSNDHEPQISVTDFPSSAVGQTVLPYFFQNHTYPDNETTVNRYGYNLSAAVRGYHLVLTPKFMSSNEWAMFLSSSYFAPVEVTNISVNRRFVVPHSKTCSYKECARNNGSEPECADYQTPCRNSTAGELLDATCDLYTTEANGTYARCASSNHCYNTHVDACDGFADCSDETDEVKCTPVDDATSTMPTAGIVVIAVVLLAVVVLFAVFLYLCQKRYRCQCQCESGDYEPCLNEMGPING